MHSLLLWTIAYAFAGASAMLAGTYAVLSATGVYAIAKAIILFLVAFGGCHGPAYTVKLKRSAGWAGASLAALATAACLLVTLWGGLGTISGGGAEIRAGRDKATSDKARDRVALSRLQAERDALPHARPAAAVSAELSTARSSTLYKSTDGCDPERISGPKAREHCRQYRQLEAELAAANAAARLESEARVVSARLDGAAPTPESDPQAAAFSLLTGFSIELSAALYAFAASLALEAMGMVAMMVAWAEKSAAANAGGERTERKSAEKPTNASKNVVSPPVIRPKEITPIQLQEPHKTAGPAATNIVPIRGGAVFGSVRKFFLQRIEPATADDERLEMRALLNQYKEWCRQGGTAPASLDRFLDEVEVICRKTGMEITTEGDKAYVVGVRLSA